jgi:hypothetical protein
MGNQLSSSTFATKVDHPLRGHEWNHGNNNNNNSNGNGNNDMNDAAAIEALSKLGVIINNGRRLDSIVSFPSSSSTQPQQSTSVPASAAAASSSSSSSTTTPIRITVAPASSSSTTATSPKNDLKASYPHGADRLTLICAYSPAFNNPSPPYQTITTAECVIPRVPRDMLPPVFEPLGHPASRSSTILTEREQVISSWCSTPTLSICSHMIGTSQFRFEDTDVDYHSNRRSRGLPTNVHHMESKGRLLLIGPGWDSSYRPQMQKKTKKPTTQATKEGKSTTTTATNNKKPRKPPKYMSIYWMDPLTLSVRPLLHSLRISTNWRHESPSPNYHFKMPSVPYFRIHYSVTCGHQGWIMRCVLKKNGPFMWCFIDASKVLMSTFSSSRSLLHETQIMTYSYVITE